MQLRTWTPLMDLEKEFRSLMGRITDSELFAFRPTTDLIREDDVLSVTVELPGVNIDEDVEIFVLDDVLTIKGEKTSAREVKDDDHIMRERHYGSFERRIPLPDGVDPDAVKATYDKGVLIVEIPIPELAESTPKAISIKTND